MAIKATEENGAGVGFFGEESVKKRGVESLSFFFKKKKELELSLGGNPKAFFFGVFFVLLFIRFLSQSLNIVTMMLLFHE